MRLGKNGQIVAETGFDGGSYEPRYQTRTSVYLGDMTHEDIRVKQEVASREAAAKAQDTAANFLKQRHKQRQYLIKSRMLQLISQREREAEYRMEQARAQKFEAARRSAFLGDFNPWIGNPFAGFGQTGEVRINPDSNEDIQIADADIPEVTEYGINNWMEDPSYYEEKVEDSIDSYTDRKVWMQDMVDYARDSARTVVGLAVPAQNEISYEEQTAKAYVANTSSGSVAPEQAQTNNAMKYGLIALAAWILLK